MFPCKADLEMLGWVVTLADLRQDDPRISPCTHKSSPGSGFHRSLQGCLAHSFHLSHCSGEGHSHVAARIAVRHGEDVDLVQVIAVSRDPFGACRDDLPKPSCAAIEYRHSHLRTCFPREGLQAGLV